MSSTYWCIVKLGDDRSESEIEELTNIEQKILASIDDILRHTYRIQHLIKSKFDAVVDDNINEIKTQLESMESTFNDHVKLDRSLRLSIGRFTHSHSKFYYEQYVSEDEKLKILTMKDWIAFLKNSENVELWYECGDHHLISVDEFEESIKVCPEVVLNPLA